MEQLVKRLKSFAWRLGAFLLISGLSWVSANLADLQLPVFWTAIIGLLLGEVTKYLNTGRNS